MGTFQPFLILCPVSLFSDAVPEELAIPLYRDQYNQEHLKPTVACLLQSAELYCRAGSLILRSDAVKPLLGHNAVIQALAQKGLYVTDQDRLVTERDLTSAPIHMVRHNRKHPGCSVSCTIRADFNSCFCTVYKNRSIHSKGISVWSMRGLCQVFSRYSDFCPHSNNLHIMVMKDSKSPLGMSA